MKFREHGGGSVYDYKVIELPPTMTALIEHVRGLLENWPTAPPVTPKTLQVKPYFTDRPTPDERIGWADTLLVVFKGYGVMGYVDQMPTDGKPAGVEPAHRD